MSDRKEAENECAENGVGQQQVEVLLGGRQSAVIEEAAALAQARYQLEPGLRAIYRLEGPDPGDLSIKLLEVNERTVPAGVVPVGFPPHPASGLHFPSVIIEVTPQEFEAIQRNTLQLPVGWVVRDDYKRPTTPDHAGAGS